MKSLIAGIVVIGLLQGCDGSSTEPNSNTSRHDHQHMVVAGTELLTDKNGKPDVVVKEFDYKQRTLHFRVVLTEPMDAQEVVWIFSAKATVAGGSRAIKRLVSPLNGNELRATLKLGSDWPVGTYTCELVVNSEPQHSFEYKITGQTEKLAFLGHSLARDDGKGLPGEIVKEFRTSDRKIHLQVSTKGIDTSKPEITWNFVRIENAKDVQVAATQLAPIELQDSVLKVSFDSPRDWPPGNYRADILRNGTKVHSFAVSVR